MLADASNREAETGTACPEEKIHSTELENTNVKTSAANKVGFSSSGKLH
jgi:hypothetical protein